MANTAKLTEEARRLERGGQWLEALRAYERVLERDPDEVDVTILNRVGDLRMRVGQAQRAVDAYERAVDAYAEAGFHNNAIALCRKVLRIAPGRVEVYRRLGQLSALSGFLADARENFLAYAEKAQRGGNLDASFEALAEFADLFPDDTEVREMLAGQLHSHDRPHEAVEQYRTLLAAYRSQGMETKAAEVERTIVEIDPDADLAPPEDARPGLSPPDQAGHAVETFESAAERADSLPLLELEPTFLGGEQAGAPEPELREEAADPFDELAARLAADPADQEAALSLAGLAGKGERREEADGLLRSALRSLADQSRYAEALKVARVLLGLEPDDTSLYQKQAEYAFRTDDRESLARAYLDLGRHLRSSGRDDKAEAVFRRVLEIDPENEEARDMIAPPPSGEDGYVDLASLVLDEQRPEQTTRFTVAEEEPSGDEDRDFADMLSRFKQKVSEHIDTSDSTSHYDLGLAFKNMGLLDEAISQFQVALRGGANPLATLEVLGQCFAEKGQFAVAGRVLERALRLPGVSDAELVGVFYQLARCEERTGGAGRAREYYERVMAVDVGFRDAARRLERLPAL